MQSIIDQLNETLHKAEEAVKANGKVEESHIDTMMELTNKFSSSMKLFDEEVKNDESVFLKLDKSGIEEINAFDKKLNQLRIDKINAVEKHDYEKAARHRDEMRKVQNKKYKSLIDLNELNIGFNEFNNALLLINEPLNNSKVVDAFVRRYRF
ncbi:UvrB/UvrC motif-containing protein [Salibacter sp.]|uniref:UvrB/UvrC motif-containing protein n=1 Tax=Salibacter sp. TaxID=2010995 RepID=UPI002870131C|nr:UvrB/UvrC motif-containing protein [Salibacter sp.]MDR9398106.1 UvrB/UvrC motif-containing protein [Salibacter sp.]MDR9487284.1 UvrB/UvrC motif-containing protein [Salibacter sp.]